MTQFFSLLYTIIKLIPYIKDTVEQFIQWYVEKEISNFKKEARDAIRKAIEKNDQRDIEKLIGNPNAGLPVDIPGGEIVDSVPGVDRNSP